MANDPNNNVSTILLGLTCLVVMIWLMHIFLRMVSKKRGRRREWFDRQEDHLLLRHSGVRGCRKAIDDKPTYEGTRNEAREMIEGAYSPLFAEKWRNRHENEVKDND